MDIPDNLDEALKKGSTSVFKIRKFMLTLCCMVFLLKSGAIVTREDMVNYEVLEKEPIETTLDGSLRVISPPPPSSGVVLAFILNLLDGTSTD